MSYCDIWVCTDCYFAHHYGVKAAWRDPDSDDPLDHHFAPISIDDAMMRDYGEVQWFAGDSDTPCEYGQPLKRVWNDDLSDNTDSETGDGIHDFSWSSCDGCGSGLGGSRYRLALHTKEA